MLGVESDAAADFSDADSVVGFSADDLAAIGAESIEDIALFTPNLEIVTAGATTPTFFIRGVASTTSTPTPRRGGIYRTTSRSTRRRSS